MKTNSILLFILLISFHHVFAEIPAVIAQRESIRIAAFYYLDDASPQVRKTISEQLIPAAISYYQATLKVNRLKSPISIERYESQGCAEVKPQELMKKGVEADLVLLVTGYKNTINDKDRSSAIAVAGPCVFDHRTKRPTIGSIHFNLGQELNTTKDAVMSYQNLLLTTLHEIGHVLGFTDTSYSEFINPLTGEKLLDPIMSKWVNGMNVTVLTVEPLRQRLRDYFDCSTLEGAYMEQQGDDGSAGAHFERRIFMDEFMTASAMLDGRVSEFYLALLEGSGWYTPDYNMGEPMFWGKGKGCGFLNTKCLDGWGKSNFPDHFCTKNNKPTCSFDRQALSSCGTSPYRRSKTLERAFDYLNDGSILSPDSFSDNCPYAIPDPKMQCKDGQSCFVGNLEKWNNEGPHCLKYSCEKLGLNDYIVHIETSVQTVICVHEGRRDFLDWRQYIECPDPLTFCTRVNPHFCRRGCMGRGTCVNDQCVCNEGYYGSDCSYRNVSATQAEGFPVEAPSRGHEVIFPILFISAVVAVTYLIHAKLQKRGQKEQEKVFTGRSIMIGGGGASRSEEDPRRLEMADIHLLRNHWNKDEEVENNQIPSQDAEVNIVENQESREGI